MPVPSSRSLRTKNIASCDPIGLQISWKSHQRSKSRQRRAGDRVLAAAGRIVSGNHHARIGTRLAL